MKLGLLLLLLLLLLHLRLLLLSLLLSLGCQLRIVVQRHDRRFIGPWLTGGLRILYRSREGVVRVLLLQRWRLLVLLKGLRLLIILRLVTLLLWLRKPVWLRRWLCSGGVEVLLRLLRDLGQSR